MNLALSSVQGSERRILQLSPFLIAGCSCRFPAMLRELEASEAELGISSYGLAETTLEEVFLAVTSRKEGLEVVPKHDATAPGVVEQVALDMSSAEDESDALLPVAAGSSSEFAGDLRRPTRILVFPFSPNSPRAPCIGHYLALVIQTGSFGYASSVVRDHPCCMADECKWLTD